VLVAKLEGFAEKIGPAVTVGWPNTSLAGGPMHGVEEVQPVSEIGLNLNTRLLPVSET
jgi:hypothetical protein